VPEEEALQFDWSGGNEEKIAQRSFFTREVVEAALSQGHGVIVVCTQPPDEQRFIRFTVVRGRAVAVVFTFRGERIRPISARPMSRKERKIHGF
jgi:uncharacterized DUF497 family protein